MSFLSNLPKTTIKSKKRLGRGYGSGKGGHTVGRGQKGQKSRGSRKVGLLFTGTKNKKSLIQRMPVLKGKNKMKPLKPKPLIIQLRDLEPFAKGSSVNLEKLIEMGIVKEKDVRRRGVKVLSGGRLSKALKVYMAVSGAAKEKIEEAGGEVVGISEDR
jgi:large subunit ribosomal protein L15